MFAYINFEFFENQLMDEILTTALEWGDYELAIEILEKSGSVTTQKDHSKKTVFTKLHLLAIIYDRQGLLGLAEKIYNRGLSCLLEEESLDPIEVALFLKNYSTCLRRLNMEDLAIGLETVADTFQFKKYPNFYALRESVREEIYPLEVANVA